MVNLLYRLFFKNSINYKEDISMSEERLIITTSERGINTDSLPYRLYQKAKKLGIWNPEDIDFSQDKIDWETKLTDAQKEGILRLISQFQAGEEAVTLDLLPLINVIAKEGRLEEEMFLTTFLWEEAKHTEFFRLALNAIGETGDLSHHHTGTYKYVFYELLPETMGRLEHDSSPKAVAEAAIVYNMFVEGILAETGYYSFYRSLDDLGLMPGLMEGINHLKRDESRHIGYGTYLLQRIISENPELYDHIMQKMMEMAVLANKVVSEGTEAALERVGEEELDTDPEETKRFAETQFKARMAVLQRAKGKHVDEIYKTKAEEVGVVD